MKTTGTIQGGDGLWIYSNVGGTNESGFSGVPAGWWDSFATEYLGMEAGVFFYSTSKNAHSDYPTGTGLSNSTAESSGASYPPEARFSVRCVKD